MASSSSRTPDMPPHGQPLNVALWKGAFIALDAESRRHHLNELHKRMLGRCGAFLRQHPFGWKMEPEDLCSRLIVRRINDKLEACPPEEAETFLVENGPDNAIWRMAIWATQPKVLRGILKEEGKRYWPADRVDWAVPQGAGSQSATELEHEQNVAMVLGYIYELAARVDPDDSEARDFLRLLVAFVLKRETWGTTQVHSLLGSESLPVRAICDLMNQAGAEPEWTYEQARKVSDRLATATKWLWRDAAAAGFGTAAEAIYGFVATKLKHPPGGGGNKTPPCEEI